jgi:TorA-specific chaperone
MEAETEKNQNAILKGYNMLLYFGGSMIMYEPVEECVVDFWSNGILNTLPVSSTNPRFIMAASQLRNSCPDIEVCLKILQEDYNKLFIDSGKTSAVPVKSHYINGYSRVGADKGSVSNFYNSYGWKNRSRYKIPDDHLGIEILFLTLLNDKYISIDDEASRNEMRKEIRRFIEQHILSWISEWNDQVQHYSGTLGYKGIASLIYACCEDIYTLLGSQEVKTEIELEFKN